MRLYSSQHGFMTAISGRNNVFAYLCMGYKIPLSYLDGDLL